jgi:hypothetical protein
LYKPELTPDGSGAGAIVAWKHSAGGGPDQYIYAQRVNSSGVVQWTADGIEICSAPDRQLEYRIVYDGSGGAIVAWEDARNTTSDYNIYKLRAGKQTTSRKMVVAR